ncbi:hypothetical protein AB0M83_35930 [Amycolatopsis sp. NPDC051106]|uniref:hypothetical protein n=1 Tax=unclassified Amycolatopsis TaxID=2618356 RepID=UPI0034262CDB
MHTGDWPATVEDALAVQERLRGRVDLTDDLPEAGVAGAEVEHRAAVPTVISETRKRTGRARAGVTGKAGPYALHEVQPVSIPLDQQRGVLGDGSHGAARSRRFAFARRAGLLTGCPASGILEPWSVDGRDESDLHRPRVPPVGSVGRFHDGSRPGYLATGHRSVVHTGCSTSGSCLRESRLPTDRAALA